MFWELNLTHTVSCSGGCFAFAGEEVAEVGEGISRAGEGFAEGGEGVFVNGGGIAELGNGVAGLGGVISLTRSGGASQSPDAPIDCCLLSHDCVFFGCG